MTEPTEIVFALFPEVTQLEFTGPFEVFRHLAGARVRLASREGGELLADGGLRFSGFERLTDIPSADVLCIPGGPGVTEAVGDGEFVAEVRRLGLGARYITSVGSGSLILAAAGLLEGKRAGCHWAWRSLLAEHGVVVDSARVVRDGNVITGAGVTAGIDFALTMAAELAGVAAAQRIQLAIEYDPSPPFYSGRPETAPPPVLSEVRERLMQRYPGLRAALRATRRVTPRV